MSQYEKNGLAKLPATLALQRTLSVTDGLFFNLSDDGSQSPVHVVEHGIRGTQNVNNASGALKNVTNIQTTESAKLDPDSQYLEVVFSISGCSLHDAITMSSDPAKDGADLSEQFRKSVDIFLQKAIAGASTSALMTVCRRISKNILGAQWLWRNRMYAQAINVSVERYLDKVVLAKEYDAFSNIVNKGLTDDSQTDPCIDAIANHLMKIFTGEKCQGLKITAKVNFGMQGVIEVYPSQNYLDEKRTGFSRSIYKVPYDFLKISAPQSVSGSSFLGQAGLTDRKIANSLRTIDSWYKNGTERCIPIEPMGADLKTGRFLRDKKQSAFELFKGLENLNPSSPDGLFMIGILLRGGVYGEKSKNDKSSNKDDKEQIIDGGTFDDNSNKD